MPTIEEALVTSLETISRQWKALRWVNRMIVCIPCQVIANTTETPPARCECSDINTLELLCCLVDSKPNCRCLTLIIVLSLLLGGEEVMVCFMGEDRR